ncbi:MAG: SMC family ATPase [Anaerolineae bacterium]|nr:SMC family ATPase [Anaerolineae bacterium]
MIPSRLRLVNFLCYREALVDFNGIHLACLTGDNGAGKSALLDAITWALWGRARAKREEELIRLGQTDMEVEFDFTLRDMRFQVSRKRSKGHGAKSALSFRAWSDRDQTWREISESALSATEKRIVQELRLDYDTFINSAFLVQGRADEFTTRPPAERKQVLGNILDLSIYDEYEERAKARAKGKGDEARSLLAQIEQIDQELAHKPEYEERVRQGEAAATRAEEARLTGEALQQALRSERQALASQKEFLDDLKTRLQRAEGDARQLEDEIKDHSGLLATYEDLMRRRKEIEDGYARLRNAREMNESLNRQLRRHADLEGERNRWQRTIDQARYGLEAELRGARERQEPLRKTVAARAAQQEALAQAQAALAKIAETERERELLRAQTQTLAEKRARLEGEVRAAKERQESLGKVVDARAAQEVALAQARAELARLVQTEKEREESQAQAQARAEERARLGSENNQYKAEAESLKERKALLERDGEARCPVCARPLTAEDRQRVVVDYDAQLGQMRVRFRENQARLETVSQEEAALKRQVEHCDKALAARSRWQRQEGQAEESLRVAAAAETELREWRQRGEEAARALAEVVRQEATLKQQMEPLDKALAERARWQRQEGQAAENLRLADAAEADLQELQRRAEALAHAWEAEEYAGEARQQLRRITAELAELAYDSQAHEQVRQEMEDLSPWEQSHRELQVALKQVETERRAVEVARTRLARLAESLAADRKRRDELEKAVLRLPEVARRLAEQDLRVEDLVNQERHAREVLAAARQQLDTCERLAQQRIEKAEAHRHAAEEQALYDDLRAAFGKKGLQAMIIETVTPQIEEEANRLLAQMTAGRMNVHLSTQRESKKGDTIETLDIIIADELGQRSYETYSGGEAFRVNFALRIALSKLLAHRAGATLQTLIVDEGFGTQDAQGRERLVEAIHSIQSEFERILVITHIDELKDLFPVRIEVTKGADGSTVSVN